MGRCVYTGIYEPGHPSADEHGFRGDVAELVRELGVTLLRYPGGNFVSGYRWQDGIGPPAQRPRRLDLAWRSVETNQVGTDEFLGWVTRLGIEPMLAVNLGTAGVREAAELVEYCNVDGDTYWSDQRKRNGTSEPYGVKLWCLGNEMDGRWQLGHKGAEEYGQLAAQAGRAMKRVDPSIKLVACGSSSHKMQTFGYWESTVLEHSYDVVDYISMHAYYEEHDGDRVSFLASGAAMDTFISGVTATIDAVAARLRRRKRLLISFDEWNVWYASRFAGVAKTGIDVSGPRIEDVYSALDAVVVGDLLSTLLNHSDRVGVACLAQLVNVIGPIMTEPAGSAWRQSIFYPFTTASRFARGNSLVTRVDAPTLSTARHGDVPAIAAAATHNPNTGNVTVLLTNRAATPASVTVRHAGFARWAVNFVRTVAATDSGPLFGATAAATAQPADLKQVRGNHAATTIMLPPESWTVLRAMTRVPS